MTEFSFSEAVNSDLTVFLEQQKKDPAVHEIGLVGSLAKEKSSPNDIDVYEVRNDVRERQIWVNASTGRKSGIQFDIFVLPLNPTDSGNGMFKNFQGPKQKIWSRN